MNELIKTLFENKSLALLGFGREGRSTYKLIRKVFPIKTLTIIDENDKVKNDEILRNDPNLQFISGKDCMQHIDEFDAAIKSPGIPSNTLPKELKKVHLTSQTDIFLQCYGHQSIGITGTKGKSTTSSLVFHILKNSGVNTLLVGNIGIPPFDCINDIGADTIIVLELSSHQLEYISHAPHIAVFLNLFQEHLDHYYTYLEYQSAKFNIGKYQGASDYFLYNQDNETINQLLKNSVELETQSLAFSLEPGSKTELRINNEWIELHYGRRVIKLYDTSQGQPLKGHHNIYNIMAASAACYLSGVSTHQISSGIKSFNGLEHRIELVGNFESIIWYNDSIATIPEATIEAIKTLQIVDTVILGGFDRGIEYDILYPYLNSCGVSNIIFVGEAGLRMKKEFSDYGVGNIHFYSANDFKQVVTIASEITYKGKICLLSPAAASYDMFKNFEERGNVYKKNVRELLPSHD
ncbi:MAG: UDP-N-acetylmuramoyl-L-alanine--D-glutamate ligase [Bacteroidales bacterium]|nr:UDP-N-acetylmuramoyl-L-alanine--D-glutamate ligase [Bacteroidales bacterium]